MLHESDFDGFDDETVDAATTGVSTASAPITTAGVAISTAEPRTPSTTTTIFEDEDVTMAMAQTLIKIKEEKAKKNSNTQEVKATQRLAEIRSRPPTKTQLRNLMMTYLKNIGGYKHRQLKGKTYEEIQGLEHMQTQKSTKKPKVNEICKSYRSKKQSEYEKEKKEHRLISSREKETTDQGLIIEDAEIALESEEESNYGILSLSNSINQC
ncbi:hypothetical protein Tco_1056491 [Tanacetum coccineum]|uniref:Uncharacterized protein n=1 Tax=Tanacetum coccineum TaxID=301880 RepID=A0ABQ5H2V5_9ASTR